MAEPGEQPSSQAGATPQPAPPPAVDTVATRSYFYTIAQEDHFPQEIRWDQVYNDVTKRARHMRKNVRTTHWAVRYRNAPEDTVLPSTFPISVRDLREFCAEDANGFVDEMAIHLWFERAMRFSLEQSVQYHNEALTSIQNLQADVAVRDDRIQQLEDEIERLQTAPQESPTPQAAKKQKTTTEQHAEESDDSIPEIGNFLTADDSIAIAKKNRTLSRMRTGGCEDHQQVQIPIRSPQEERQRREGTVNTMATGATGMSTRNERTAKFPDPPQLTDGKDPTFEEWEEGIKDKLHQNADWYVDDSARLAYIRTRVKGDAANHLRAQLHVKKEHGSEGTADGALAFLRGVYLDPHRRLNAKGKLRNLQMRFTQDFNEFRSEFIRLSNEARIPKAQWKEDLHDKLYDSLRTQMAVYMNDEDIDFQDYCSRASVVSRSLGQASENRKSRKAARAGTTSTKVKETTTLNSAAVAPSKKVVDPATVTCFNCNKKGHFATDCTEPKKRTEIKNIEISENTGEEEIEPEGNESENE